MRLLKEARGQTGAEQASEGQAAGSAGAEGCVHSLAPEMGVEKREILLGSKAHIPYEEKETTLPGAL